MWRGYRKLSSVALAAIACFAMQLTSSKTSANVLSNAGFEAPDASAGDQTENVNWGPFNAAFATRSVTPNSGLQSLKTFGPFFVGGGAGVSQGGFAASAGQLWSASAFLRDDTSDAMQGNNFAVVQLQYLDSANNVLHTFESPHFTTANPTNVWTPEVATGIAPAGTATAQITLVHVQLNSPVTGGSVFWDDASLDQVVPEPASMGLLAVGGIAFLRRRR